MPKIEIEIMLSGEHNCRKAISTKKCTTLCVNSHMNRTSVLKVWCLLLHSARILTFHISSF
uniref:Uncharacterized protein n=1 Tax=Anguilla anguilla TaxID=7936 RepID=A0A0E9X1W7_ANGAN